MGNERVTENLVRNRLRGLGYFDVSNNVKVDEQKSGIEAVTRLLKQASKAGGGGKGAPEFIVSNPDDPDFLVIIECKANPKDHVSPDLNSILLGTPLNELPGETAFISALDWNNGLRQRISQKPRHPAGVLTVNYNGNGVAEAFYQPEAFFASDDVNVLEPRFEMDIAVALFVCAVIRREKYRFNYGRKWNLERMKESVIRLPATAQGKPDCDFMRRYITALPYSRTACGAGEVQAAHAAAPLGVLAT